MFDVYDPLGEYEEGQEYEITNEDMESFTSDLELEEILNARPFRFQERRGLRLVWSRIETLLSESQLLNVSPSDEIFVAWTL